MVQEGQRAPAFTMPIGGDGRVALKDLKGKKVVLFFYPRDDTPSCTAEAKDFKGLKRKFSANGMTVIGVSKDTAAKHENAAVDPLQLHRIETALEAYNFYLSD